MTFRAYDRLGPSCKCIFPVHCLDFKLVVVTIRCFSLHAVHFFGSWRTEGALLTRHTYFSVQEHTPQAFLYLDHNSDRYQVMDPGPAPLDGDVNRNTVLTGLSWALASLAFVFVALRIYSRVFITRNMCLDDWAMIWTLVSSRLIYATGYKP